MILALMIPMPMFISMVTDTITHIIMAMDMDMKKINLKKNYLLELIFEAL